MGEIRRGVGGGSPAAPSFSLALASEDLPHSGPLRGPSNFEKFQRPGRGGVPASPLFLGVVGAQGKVTSGRAWAEDRFRDWSGGEGCLTLGLAAEGGRRTVSARALRSAPGRGGGGRVPAVPRSLPPFWAGEKRGLGDVDLTAGFLVGGAGNGGRAGKALRAGREPGNRGPPRRVLIPLPSPLP